MYGCGLRPAVREAGPTAVEVAPLDSVSAVSCNIKAIELGRRLKAKEHAKATFRTPNKLRGVDFKNEIVEQGIAQIRILECVGLIDRDDKIESLPLLTKPEVANRILDRVVQLLGKKGGE